MGIATAALDQPGDEVGLMAEPRQIGNNEPQKGWFWRMVLDSRNWPAIWSGGPFSIEKTFGGQRGASTITT
ncbi:MAG: hypothetical protein ACJ8EF_19715 [Bradyrhizobium sp.]